MSLKAIRCPNCGGDIEVSQDKDFANCDYCGGIISVRDSIKIVTNTNTGNLHELARNALQVGNFGESYDFFNKVLEIDINNLEAWIGKLITNITSKDSFNANFNKVLSLSESTQKTNQLLVEYCTYLIKFETNDIIEIALECITDHPDADLFFLVEYSKFLIKNKRHFEIEKLNTLVDRNIDDEKLKTLKESISLILIDDLDKHDILSKSRIISSSEFIFSICSDQKILNKLFEKITSIIASYNDATTSTNIDNASLSEILNLIRYSSEKSKVYKNFENLENLCNLLYREYSTCSYDKRINNKDYYKNIKDIFLSLTRYIKKETGRSEKNYIKGYKSKFLSRFVLVVIGIIAIHYFINFFISSDNKNETKDNINLEVKDSINKNNAASLSKNDGTIGVFKGFNNKNLNKIITYAYNNETDKINKIVNQFKSQSKIPRGDRVLARKLNDVGLAQMKENKFSEAIFSFTQATEADLADIEIINNLAVAYFENNQFEDGLKVIEKSLLLSIDRTIPWFALYDALARQHFDLNSTCGSLLLALKFSKNQTKTLDFIENDLSRETDRDTIRSKRKAIDCAKTKFSSTEEKPADQSISENVNTITHTISKYYVDNDGNKYSSTTNDNGVVLHISGTDIFLGKSCDAYSKQYGNGTWAWIKGGFFINFGRMGIGFPKQTLDIDNNFACGASPPALTNVDIDDYIGIWVLNNELGNADSFAIEVKNKSEANSYHYPYGPYSENLKYKLVGDSIQFYYENIEGSISFMNNRNKNNTTSDSCKILVAKGFILENKKLNLEVFDDKCGELKSGNYFLEKKSESL